MNRPLLLIVLAALLAACPNWQRPTCSSPGAYSCANDQPQYCSTSTGELTPVGDEPCGRTGQACVIDPDGIGHCAPAADGGAR